jgi:hypothetical protein
MICFKTVKHRSVIPQWVVPSAKAIVQLYSSTIPRQTLQHAPAMWPPPWCWAKPSPGMLGARFTQDQCKFKVPAFSQVYFSHNILWSRRIAGRQIDNYLFWLPTSIDPILTSQEVWLFILLTQPVLCVKKTHPVFLNIFQFKCGLMQSKTHEENNNVWRSFLNSYWWGEIISTMRINTCSCDDWMMA